MKIIKRDVNIYGKRLTRLPMMNGKYLFEDVKVIGEFDCADNRLSSLEGCPVEVDGDFDCSFNHLRSMQHAPKIVNGDFHCQGNPHKFTLPEISRFCLVRGRVYL